MKYVTQAKKVEYSAVCEPCYAADKLPKTPAEWHALKDVDAINKVKTETNETDLFAMAKGQVSEFKDMSKKIVDIAVCLKGEGDSERVLVQRNVECISLVSAPGIVFRNPTSGEAINVYKGVVKMFAIKEDKKA